MSRRNYLSPQFLTKISDDGTLNIEKYRKLNYFNLCDLYCKYRVKCEFNSYNYWCDAYFTFNGSPFSHRYRIGAV